MRKIISILLFVCAVCVVKGQHTPTDSEGLITINNQMFVDMGVKSDNGNLLLWETQEWFPNKNNDILMERPTSLRSERFVYQMKNGEKVIVTTRYPSINEWKRFIQSVSIKKPKNYGDAVSWHAIYPRNTNVYRSAINGNEIWLRWATYFSSKDDAIVQIEDPARHVKDAKCIWSKENCTIGKGYVRRVVEVVYP